MWRMFDVGRSEWATAVRGSLVGEWVGDGERACSDVRCNSFAAGLARFEIGASALG